LVSNRKIKENGMLLSILSFWWLLLLLIAIPLSAKTILGWVMIPDDQNGVVIKKWGLGKGSRLPEGQIIARNSEAGVQATMLEPGLHFLKWWWMYKIEKVDIITIEKDYIGSVESIDGEKLPAGAILATKVIECNSFQDATTFLNSGGQKGWQRNYLTNGQYRINPYLFKVTPRNALDIDSDKIGLVTTLDGEALPPKHIAGKVVGEHKTFQDADRFLNAGGNRGLQEEVLLPGKYYINPNFANVETEEMIRVEVGFVGVVNSFIGDAGQDVSGEGFKHGNIVKEGQKGIWERTLDPGLYPINPRLQDVLMVPTTNIVLNWKDGTIEEHQLDTELKTITVRSQDGFTFKLEVSQIINISDKAAPKVIARFGTIKNLVAQVLEPTIGNYFRNSAQTSDALEFVDGRKERQEEAREHIKKILEQYDIECVDTLIGDINPPPELMQILADRKIAEQQQEMYKMQKASETERQEFVKAETAATKEEQLTGAKYDKEIATQTANAQVETAKGNRESAKITADGEAYVLKTVGTAKAQNINEVGSAEAGVIQKKTEAMGQEQFAIVQVAEHLAKNNVKIVPEILVQGSQGGNGGLVEALIGTELLKKDMFEKKPETTKTTEDEEVQSPEESGAAEETK
jgi:uncharacterized membrane protein YqiK